jgi:hypothetical protein
MEKAWLALPQAVSRASSVAVFALVAQRADSGELGAFAVATAISSASLALAPALVGKPLAALTTRGTAGDDGRLAQSAALLGSLVAGLGLLLGAVACDGLVQLALLGGAIGVPAVMIVESTFWRDAFTRSNRYAGGLLSGAYSLQTLAVATATLLDLTTRFVILTPFVSLAVFGAIVVLLRRDVGMRHAWIWFRDRRPSWLPYVLGVGASVLLFQTISDRHHSDSRIPFG